jgi:hypothetical protein
MEPFETSSSSERQLEIDPRFPSGPWVGFWIQEGVGKQRMTLHLWFREGRVAGTGSDVVGRFAMDGTYDLKTGRCLLIKQYIGAHRLQYRGASEGDELWLWGIWELPNDRGGFHLWPERAADPTRRILKAAKPVVNAACNVGRQLSQTLFGRLPGRGILSTLSSSTRSLWQIRTYRTLEAMKIEL